MGQGRGTEWWMLLRGGVGQGRGTEWWMLLRVGVGKGRVWTLFENREMGGVELLEITVVGCGKENKGVILHVVLKETAWRGRPGDGGGRSGICGGVKIGGGNGVQGKISWGIHGGGKGGKIGGVFMSNGRGGGLEREFDGVVWKHWNRNWKWWWTRRLFYNIF